MWGCVRVYGLMYVRVCIVLYVCLPMNIGECLSFFLMRFRICKPVCACTVCVYVLCTCMGRGANSECESV